ncbi:hypothetical protein PBI_GRAYSON_116 [Rhodococcus phage Grayson]|nr:hypothetical protein PBI_GRAYSON_116 [Rhodococcus phage Grayson]
MSDVQVVEEQIVITFTLEEAQVLKTVIGQFNPEYAGPLSNLWHEMTDAGIDGIKNLFLVARSTSPELQLFLEEPEDV